MRHRYTKFNGKPFQTLDDLDIAGNFLDFVLTYGDDALKSLREMEKDPEHNELLQQLLDQGLLEKIKGRFRLTPRAVNAMQRRALMEVFSQLKAGVRGEHTAADTGAGGERLEGTKPYEFGDPVSELNLEATMRNALRRIATDARVSAPTPGKLTPIRLRAGDFERFEIESHTSSSTVVLIDQSGSMARFNRFMRAKKCAMALIALTRQRFPADTIDVVGFHSGADVIAEDKLPLLMPKPITTYAPSVHARAPLDQVEKLPPHFTNLHLGLLKADRILRRRAGANKMIFIITDGQPTAYTEGGRLILDYPPTERCQIVTLREATLIARRGVRICAFALADDYWDMDWLGFIDQLGRLTRGVTFHCADDLMSCVMESYLSGRRKKTYIA